MKPDTRPSASRVAAHRARLREQGLRPLEVWAYPEDHARIKDFAREISRASAPEADDAVEQSLGPATDTPAAR
jgi:hypothetical protein